MVEVRYFAGAAEAFGCAQEFFDLPAGSDLGALKAAVLERHGADAEAQRGDEIGARAQRSVTGSMCCRRSPAGRTARRAYLNPGWGARAQYRRHSRWSTSHRTESPVPRACGAY